MKPIKIDGKELIVSPSSFSEVMELKEVITQKLKKDGIRVDLSGINLDENNLEKIEIGDIGWVIEPILTLMTDSAIRNLLFRCAKRAKFGDDKIDIDFFEDVENRKYYYPIMMEVIKVNISPFLNLASSMFAGFKDLKEKFLGSPSDPQN